MTPESTLAKYYAERAPYYERVYHKPERQNDLQQLRQLVAKAFAGKRVLEIACGTGYWTEIISHRAESVLGLDYNEEVLAYARQKPCAPGKVTFMQADAFALPTLPGGFNAALSGFWWSHVPKSRLQGFLRSLHAALEPGAMVMFFDNAYVAGSSNPLSRKDSDGNPLSSHDPDGNTYQERVLDDGSVHEIVKNFPTAEELKQRLPEGASDIEVRFLTYYWLLQYRMP